MMAGKLLMLADWLRGDFGNSQARSRTCPCSFLELIRQNSQSPLSLHLIRLPQIIIGAHLQSLGDASQTLDSQEGCAQPSMSSQSLNRASWGPVFPFLG